MSHPASDRRWPMPTKPAIHALWFFLCLISALSSWGTTWARAETDQRISVQVQDLPAAVRLIAAWGDAPEESVYLARQSREVSLKIKATGRHNPAGRGSLVRVVSLVLPGGKTAPESEFQVEPGWIYRDPENKRALVFTGSEPAAAVWRGRVEGPLVLRLAENRSSGIAEISYAGRAWSEDLYAAKHANRDIPLPLPSGPSRWSADLPDSALGRPLELRILSPCAHKGSFTQVTLEQAGGSRVWKGRDLPVEVTRKAAPFIITCRLPSVGNGVKPSAAQSPAWPDSLERPRDLKVDHRYHNLNASAACGVPDTAWWPRTSFDAQGVLHFVQANSPHTSPRGAPTSLALGNLSIGPASRVRPRPLEGWLPIFDWDLPQGSLRLVALPDSWAVDAVEVQTKAPVEAVLEVYDGSLALAGGVCTWQGKPLLALVTNKKGLTGNISPEGRVLRFTLPAGRSLLLRNLALDEAERFGRSVVRAGELGPSELAEETAQAWRWLLGKAARLHVSNPAVDNAWQGCLTQLFLLRSWYQGALALHGTGGTGQGGAYDWGFWHRDYAWHNTALAVAGLAEPAGDELELFWQHQAPDGLLAAPPGQYDGFGQVTRAAFQVLALRPGSVREQEVFDRLMLAAKAQMALGPAASPGSPRACLPLLPPGEGDGGITGGNKLVLQHNTWTLLGLDRLARLARRLGREADAAWLEERRAGLLEAFRGALPFYFVSNGLGRGYLSGSLSADGFQARHTPSWMGYSLFWPQNLLGPGSQAWMLAATFRHLESHAFDHLPIGLGWEKDTVWPYNAANWAQTLLARGRPGAALAVLQSVLNTSWYSGTWAEEYFVTDQGRGLGKARGGYDIPNTNLHITAPATVLLLMRNLVLREDLDSGTLHLAQGLPWGWKEVELNHAPTMFGRADFSLSRQPDGLEARLSLGGPAWAAPKRLVLHLPLAPGEKPIQAKVAGRELPLGGDQVVLEIGKQPSSGNWQWEVRLDSLSDASGQDPEK